MSLRVFCALFLLTFLFFTFSPAVAQTGGSISGVVADAHGQGISNAHVRATAPGGTVLETSTGSGGGFLLAPLPPGTYTIEISAPGAWKAIMDSVQVAGASDTRLGTVRLATASATMSGPALETAVQPTMTAAEPEEHLGPTSGVELKQLPGVAENKGLDRFVLLEPGVTAGRDDDFSTGNPVSFSTNGLRSRDNDQQIDGQYNNENTVGGPAVRVGNPESIKQYTVVTTQQGSQYGRNSGAVIDVLTKSGTDAWHGSVFGTENNSVFNATDNAQRFAGLSDASHRNDEFAGFTVGGPLVRDKWFFFGSFDQEIVSQETVYRSDSLTPTPAGLAALAGCFPVAPGAQMINVLTRFGPYGISGGNPTPAGTPVTGIAPGCAPASFAGVERTLPTPLRTFDWMARTDVHLGSELFSARYLYQHESNGNLSFGDSAAAGYPVDLTIVAQGVQLGWTHNFSPHMVNDARLAYTRFNTELGGNSLETVPRVEGMDNAVTNVFFSAPGLLGMGVQPGLPQSRTQNSWQARDDWSYLIGRHQLKAGANYLYQRTPTYYLENLNGDFRFFDWSTFLTNTPNLVRGSDGNRGNDFREHDFIAYLQDDWKLRSNLTVTLGLTWSYFSQPADGLHDLTAQREQSGSGLWNPALSMDVRSVPTVDAPLTNFAPNVGFAYSPQWGGFLTGHGKTVVRGGYRMLYDPPFYSMYRDMASSAPTAFRPVFVGAAAVAFPLPAVPTGPNVRAELAAFLTPGVLDPRSQTQYTLGPGFSPDRVHSWTFGIERELTKNTTFEARYVGNHVDNLFQSVNANPYVADLAAFFPGLVPAGVTPCAAPVVPEALGRVDCNRGVVNQRGNSGYSDYHALQLEFRTRNLFDQFSFRTGYTWSKTTDNISEILSTGTAGNTNAFLQDPLAGTGSEHTLSGLDFPQRWTLSFVEQLPFFQQQRGAMGHIFGGWGLAGDYTLASGQLYTPSQMVLPSPVGDFFDSAFVGSFNDFEIAHPFLGNVNAPETTVGAFAGDACVLYPAACLVLPLQLISINDLNQTGAVVPVTVDSVHYILNGGTASSIFGTPFGNAGRNIARNEMTNLGNFSVFKNTKLSERVNFQFRVTLLNVFNHPNYGSIDPFIEDAGLRLYRRGFGDPTVTDSSGRTIFFGGRITF